MLLAEEGRTVTAVDIRQNFLDYAQTRYEKGNVHFLAANVFDNPPLGTFVLVFGNQIIEPLVSPAAFMRPPAQYARPGGIIVITTPNHDYTRSGLPSYTELGDPKQHENKKFSAGGGGPFFAY